MKFLLIEWLFRTIRSKKNDFKIKSVTLSPSLSPFKEEN